MKDPQDYNSICRSCKHKHSLWSRCCVDGGFLICNCKNFIPSDNLEYLEWEADKLYASR